MTPEEREKFRQDHALPLRRISERQPAEPASRPAGIYCQVRRLCQNPQWVYDAFDQAGMTGHHRLIWS
jgi:hypothetical protein